MKRGVFAKTIIAAGVILLAAEVTLRMGVGMGNPPLVRLDPVTEYELIGPANYHRWGNTIDVNAQGMRAPALAATPTLEERRILLIGDSVIYGGHFIDQRHTIAAQLSTVLNGQSHLSGCKMRALPVAASSWGPVNQAGFLKRDGVFGARNAAIIVSAHDLYDTPEGGTTILPYRTKKPMGAFHDAVIAVIERVFPPEVPDPALSLDESARLTKAALESMLTQLRENGVSPVLFYHPTVTERQTSLRDEARIFEAWAAENALLFVDISAAALTADAYQDDIHPNADGAAEIARFLGLHLGGMIPDCAG